MLQFTTKIGCDDQCLNLMMSNYSENITTLPLDNQNEADFLFITLHNYHVTIADLALNSIIALLGLWITALNSLLVETLIRCHAKLDVTDMFIYSLAVTDALIGLSMVYNSTYNIVNFQNRYECLVRFGFLSGLLTNSTGHISLLTFNRYIKITRPLNYQKTFGKRNMIILSMGVWCFSLLFGLTPLMGWNNDYLQKDQNANHTVCRYFGITTPAFIATNISLFWVPLIVMIVLYSLICKIALHHSRIIATQEQQVFGKNLAMTLGRSWRFTKTVLIIIGVYFFCWLPAGIFLAIQLAGSLKHLDYTVQGNILIVTTSLGFLNSLLNPLIYATKIPCVKQRFKHVFCCKDSRRESIQSSVYTTQNARQINMEAF